MPDENRPPTLELHERVAEFAYRCGRVLAVPIAQDKKLLRMAHKMGVTTNSEGLTEFVNLLPPELQVDALAARARPIFLNDRCSYKTGLKALRRLLRKTACVDAKEYCEAVVDLRQGWSDVHTGAARRYFLAAERVDGPSPMGMWSDHELAEAWLYGDLVHASEGHQDTATRKERLIAGWARHADVIELARTSVAFIQGFDQDLGLGIPKWAFDTDDLPNGLLSTGQAVEMWLAPVHDGPLDVERLKTELSDATRTKAHPGADFSALHPPPPGKTMWIETLPPKLRESNGDQGGRTLT